MSFAVFDDLASAFAPSILLTVLALLALAVAFLFFRNRAARCRLRRYELLLNQTGAVQVTAWSVNLERQTIRIHRAPSNERLRYTRDPLPVLFGDIHPDDHAGLEASWWAALAGKQDFDVTHRVVTEAGLRWRHSKAMVDYGTRKQPRVVVGVTQDITDLYQARDSLETFHRHLEKLVAARSAELREAEAQTRLILESTAEGMLGLDTEGKITFANRSACEMLGYDQSELIGREVQSALECRRTNGKHCPSGACALMHTLRKGEQVRREDVVFRRADGRTLPVSCSTRPMWRDGEIIGAVSSFVDITYQMQAREAREKALSEAQRLANLRSEFIANMSHEIRTPLNAVLGLAQLGARERNGGNAVETFNRILESGKHLLEIVNDILDFSKIEAGKLSLEDGTVILGEVIDRVVDLTAAQACGKGLEFRIEEALDLPRSMRGDALRLSQILVNLVGNAIKFTESGSVVLTVGVDGDELLLRVRDTGIGMDAHQLDRLFNAFEQADSTTTRRFGGTGLGLVITKHLVDLMQGRIWVASRVGEGSVFEIRIPLRDATAAPMPEVGGNVLLAGLGAVESRHLVDRLSAFGAVVEMCSTEEVFERTFDCTVLHLNALADPSRIRQIGEVLESNRKVIVVVPPGANGNLPAEIRGRIISVEEPLRHRHLVTALKGGTRQPQAVASLLRRLSGVRVLAAEDNAVNRLVLEEMLASEGAELVCVENGREAVEQVRTRGSRAFDVVLTDIQMPDMDGYETTRQIHSIAPLLPVVGLTAHAMPEERARCLAAGMVEHVSKPIDIDVLVAVIRMMVYGSGQAFARTQDHPAPVPAQPALIDWGALQAQFGKRPGVIRKLVDILLQTTASVPEELRQLAAAENHAEIASVAHKIKGSAASIKAGRLMTIAAETEKTARANASETGKMALRLADGVEALLGELDQCSISG